MEENIYRMGFGVCVLKFSKRVQKIQLALRGVDTSIIKPVHKSVRTCGLKLPSPLLYIGTYWAYGLQWSKMTIYLNIVDTTQQKRSDQFEFCF